MSAFTFIRGPGQLFAFRAEDRATFSFSALPYIETTSPPQINTPLPQIKIAMLQIETALLHIQTHSDNKHQNKDLFCKV